MTPTFFLLVIINATLVSLTVYNFLQSKKKHRLDSELKKQLALRIYDSALLDILENQISTNFSIQKIAASLTNNLASVIEYDFAAFMIFENGRLVMQSINGNKSSNFDRESIKNIMRSSLEEMTVKIIEPNEIEDGSGITLGNSNTIQPIQSYFNIPLFVAGKTLGVIFVGSLKKDFYVLEQTIYLYHSIKKTLEALSTLQRIVEEEKITREKKEKETERRAYQAEVLKELNERVGYSLDLIKIIETITGSIGRLLDYNVISYMLIARDRIIYKSIVRESVSHLFMSDLKSKMLEAFSAMLNKTISAAELDESISGLALNDLLKENVRSFFNLPFTINGRLIGIITVASPKLGLYNEEETAILYTIASQASSAVTKLTDVLEREKGKLNALVASLDDGILMIDPNWNLIVANAKSRELLGFGTVQPSIFDIFDKLSGKIDIRTKIERAIARNETIEPAELELEERILQVVILQVKGRLNENLGAVVIFHDITRERRARGIIEKEVRERTHQLKEEHSRLKASIDSLNIGFFMVDPSHRIVMINPNAQRILNIKQYDTTNLTPDQAIKYEDQLHIQIVQNLQGYLDIHSLIQQCISNNKPVEIKELKFKEKFLRIFISPIVVDLDHRIIGAVVLIEDITEAKILERSKDEFFSIASHELRTPLTSIRGNTAMIKDYYAEDLKDPGLKEMIDDIHHSSIKLIEIVNDFLNVSRLEQGRMEFNFDQIDPRLFVEDVFKQLNVIAAEKNLFLKMEPPQQPLPKIIADPDRLKEVLINLIGNAIKFTEHGGITISFELNQTLKMLVKDTGRGISKTNQTLLFHKFQQASSSLFTRDTTRGTGLGLYISKLMMEKMNGKIYLQSSEEGQGSVFALELPISIPSTNQVVDSKQSVRDDVITLTGVNS